LSSPSSNKLSTPFILGSAPRTRMNKPAIEQEKPTTALGAADPVISDGAQPPLSSRYLDMLVQVDEAPPIRDFLASLLTWLLLAGYVVFPGAFTSLSNAKALNEFGNVGKTILTEVQKGILSVAAVCCGLSAIGIGWLWQKCRTNYVWLEYHLFLQVFYSNIRILAS
jgi:hypothetical protein